LYVYFSGHGATSIDGVGDDVALLLAKWSPALARLALSSNRYCSALGGLGLFEEVAMFLDCCRTAAVGALGLPPTFTCKVTSAGATARAFIAYATEAGRPAFERPQEGVWHGAFTRRLLSILKRFPRGIEAAALKETLERELREDAVQRAHVVNGLRAGSTFGRLGGAPPILQVKPDDEWEGKIKLFDGMGHLVARHRPSDGTWTLPLAVGLYKLTYGVRGRREQELIDHGRGGPTRLDFRPRLREPIVRVWSAATADRWIPEEDRMQAFTLRNDEPVYIGSAPECTIRVEGQAERSCDARIRYDDGCYVIEDLGSRHGTLFHGRIQNRLGIFPSAGEPIRSKQLRDGDLFRCGQLRLMVGHVEPGRCIVAGLVASVPLSRGPVHRVEPGRYIVAGLAGMGSAGMVPKASERLIISDLAMEPHNAICRLSLHCIPDVSVTVYDAGGAVRARGQGDLAVLLPRGLYRIEAELFDRVTSRVFELVGDASCTVEVPEISTPAVEISRIPGSANPYTVESTTNPLGAGPRTSRLLLFLHPEPRASLPSEPVSIHDEDGHRLTEVSRHMRPLLYSFVLQKYFLVYSCAVAPGTYYLRAPRSRRNVAITIPADHVARVFVADVGVVRLDDMRISLTPASAKVNDHVEIARAMEGVIAALRSPGGRLSKSMRSLLRTFIHVDLCFGIAAAHLLARTEDRTALDEVLYALAPYADIPDIAILQHAYAPRVPDAAFTLTTPPLLRASLHLAMTHSAFDLRGAPADNALARAACRSYADSIWCTWSHDADDEGWIAPTIAELRRDEPDVVALGRRLGIPPRRVQQALDELDAGPSGAARG
ncbi:MAG TPA: FHA domain-containing protein, partial [Gemmatimonadaceae bacterium]|nr:FHA domain-containing protein [Gemmatimonadaceae bacterium]